MLRLGCEIFQNNLSPVNVADLLQRETAHLAGQVLLRHSLTLSYDLRDMSGRLNDVCNDGVCCGCLRCQHSTQLLFARCLCYGTATWISHATTQQLYIQCWRLSIHVSTSPKPCYQVLREDSIIKQWNESIFRETLPIEDCMVPSQSMGNK